MTKTHDYSQIQSLLFYLPCSSFRDSTYGEGVDGGEDNYPSGIPHQGDQNGT